MKKVSMSIIGKDVQEYIFGTDKKELDQALLFIELAILRGDSVTIDPINTKDAPIPEYLKDYVSL
jgi:hypothetical protein